MKILQTQKGKESLNHDGFTYRLDVARRDKKMWRCSKTGCKGRIWTSVVNRDPTVRKEHDHPPSAEVDMLMKAVRELKSMARTRPSLVVMDTIHNEIESRLNSSMAPWTRAERQIAAVFAPLKADNTLNLELIPIYIDHLIGIGIEEVFVNGTAGECMSMTVDERKSIAEAWASHGREKLKRIIVHCGAGNLEDAKILVLHAATLNIDAIAILPPTYFRPTSLDDILDYCVELCKLAPTVPFLYYHIPEVTGINVKMYDFFLNVALNFAKCPNLIGCKYTSIDLADANRTSLIENGKFDVILGAESVLLGALAMGVKASIGVSYSVCGAKISRMIEHFHNGDFESARKEQNEIQEIFFDCGQIKHGVASSFNVNELIASFKYALKIVEPKLDCGPVRLPLKQPSVAKIGRLKGIFKKS